MASRTSSGGLRPQAQDFCPQVARKDSPTPIRTQRRSDVLTSLDAIPFTPSQGVCTPSPTNLAAMWVPHPFFHQQWGSMGGSYAGSPGASSGGSDSSMMHGASSQPGTPGGGGYAHMGGASMVWSGFCQPMPYSPTALQIAAASGALGSDPSTPVRNGRRSSPGSGGGSGQFVAVMPGSPMMAGPGHMMFAKYFNGGMAGSSRSLSPPESKDSSGSGDEGEGSEGMSSAGSGTLEVSDAAHQIATAMCAGQQLPGEPPQQLLELASLLHAYGLVSAVTPVYHHNSSAPHSPDTRRQHARQRMQAAPKLNQDGSVRLNARQRRTLRRAQERALNSLMEAQTKAYGITADQAASNLASIGVASMLLGSPPPEPAAMHSPQPAPYMAAPLAMSPGGMGISMPMMGLPHDYSAMQGMAAAAMAQQAAAAGYFDAAAAAGYGLSIGLGGEMPLAMPMQYGTPPPQHHGGSRQYGAQRSGGYRGAPSRMSRFAPQDAVAAY